MTSTRRAALESAAPARPYNPADALVAQGAAGLGCSRFARHYSGNLGPPHPRSRARTPATVLIPCPRGTEMFQFPRCPPRGLCIQPAVSWLAPGGVAPFGSDRLIARLQLPGHVSPLSASFFGPWPLLQASTPHPAPLGSHKSVTPRPVFQATRMLYDAILLARFGKIEVHHTMRLSRCYQLQP